MIKKEGGMFHVYSESGKKFGTYKSRKAAQRRIAQMEMFKSIKRKK